MNFGKLSKIPKFHGEIQIEWCQNHRKVRYGRIWLRTGLNMAHGSLNQKLQVACASISDIRHY